VRFSASALALTSSLSLFGLRVLTSLMLSDDFELIVRQNPNRARVAGGKEKGE
jgi:hypothetical protein